MPSPQGCLIINADDWGRDLYTTGRILDCVLRRTVSSVSAMVFMEDSERAAGSALEQGIDAGLHLNLTTPLSAKGTPARLHEHQQRLSRYLNSHRFAQALYHPGLTGSFEYVVAAQLEEFRRIYLRPPQRIDGHHHMHLCANVVARNLLPSGTVVRRNFTFQGGEKGLCNRVYRRLVDRKLRRHHQLSDFFFALPPLDPQRLQRIFSLARQSVVEVECHPAVPPEYRFLTESEILRLAADVPIATCYAIAQAGAIPVSATSSGQAPAAPLTR